MRARRLALTGVAAALVAVLVTGCGGDGPSADQVADDLVEQTDGALDEDQAQCVAEGLEASFGEDGYRRLVDAAELDDLVTADADVDDVDEVRVAVVDIFAACDALGATAVGRP